MCMQLGLSRTMSQMAGYNNKGQKCYNYLSIYQPLMQAQDNIEKVFFEQIKPGDYIDARYADDDWKLAKVIDRDNKYISIIFDGCPPNNDQVYINPMRVKPLRSVTTGYTGPMRGVHLTITPIPDLAKHISMLNTIIEAKEAPSPYKVTQYLRGELFATVNSLLMSDFRFAPEEIEMLNKFFIQLVGLIGMICARSKDYLTEYFESNANNKLAYLTNYKIAMVCSLSELLILVNSLISQGSEAPKLLKAYKSQILQANIISHVKQYLPILGELYASNDGNGRWLPTFIRVTISKILIKYKEEGKLLAIPYDIKDYLEFYSYWPILLLLLPSEANQKKLVQYVQNVMINQSPFDSKLKSLIMLRRMLDKQQKLAFLSPAAIIELLNNKKIVDSLLKYFNPQIFKRYIPILKHMSQNSKKSLTQTQVDDLFKLMKTSHESETNLIYEIIVNISQFIGVDTLDNIYSDIQKNIDINEEASIRFIRDFTIKAIQNFNQNKNKGFFSALIGKKKCSSKHAYYGLNLFFKQIQDGQGKIVSKNVAFVVTNIGTIFENEVFHHERLSYMQSCVTNIDKKESYGQSVRLLHRIISTYPLNVYIGQSQESVVSKLDDKHRLVDILIKALKPLQKQCRGDTSKNPLSIKVNFETSIKYCYNFLEQFGNYFKHPIELRHINYLWHMPHLFDFLRKPIETNEAELPQWKRKYFKKLSIEIIKSILLEILKEPTNIIPSQQFFECIHELIISYNLNRSLELTERATIRYKKLSDIVGLNFYFKFLDKIITVNRSDWRKGQKIVKNNELVEKVIRTIFEIHLRPHEYYLIEIKAENWKMCLMKVIRSIHQQNVQICVNMIELFLQLIRGRQFKDISLNGKLDIVVSYENRQKTITLPRNASILKLRNSIMQAYKIKWNFEMFNTALRRQVKFVEEQDFSVNAMGYAIKGPTIIVKKVQEGELYYQYGACERFMQLIEAQQQFYKIVFGLLKAKLEPDIQSRIWKIIEKVPVNRVTMDKIKNCKDFKKQDWQKFLQPVNMEELQYSINIIYNLLINANWMDDFRKTQGNVVIEELYLTMLKSMEPLSEKIKLILSKIMLKVLDHSVSSQDKKGKVVGDGKQCIKEQQKQQKQKEQQKQKQKEKEKENVQNLQKIGKKIMESLYQEATKIQNMEQAGNQGYTTNSIQCLNLMLKMLLSLSLKKNCPQIQVTIKFLLNDGILLKISDILLFQPRDTFFIQQILQKVALNMGLQKSYKHQIFRQYIVKYLNYSYLCTKKTTENFFIFLIDFLHSMDKQETQKMYQNNKDIVECIKKFILDTLSYSSQSNKNQQKQKLQIKNNEQIRNGVIIKKNSNQQKVEHNEQMIHGCFKLLNQTFTFEIFNYDTQGIFRILLENFVLSDSTAKASNLLKVDPSKAIKIKIKYKKILYEIVKLMIFGSNALLDIFIDRVSPKLQTAQWRRNIYSSWSLQPQRKEKKYFCGLQNLAATCYINCLFQQLFMIKRFSDRFINIDSLAYKELPETNQVYQLQKLLVYLKYGNKRSYTTRPFCQSFITYEGAPIDPTVQNDADQFFNALMDKIESFLKSSGHHDILEDTFEGKLSNQLNCEGCPHSSEKIQSFMSIGLNIKNKKTLQAALDGYVEGEILDGDNAYFCQKCEKKVRTMKRLCIKQVPNILVIVLKRFSYNFDEMRKIKINDECKFPASLNVKKYTSEFNLGEECKPDEYYDYKLRGVVIHSGTSEGGHYYSFIKNEQKDSDIKEMKEMKEGNDDGAAKWYEFNDEMIEQADYKRIEEEGFGGEEKDSQIKIQKHKSAYILFYEKKTLVQKQKSNIMQEQLSQPFQSQLSQLVISQNRNSQFLSIILDPLFIRLSQSISMSGHARAHHYILLYFHTVLMRDKNKQDNLANIYRIILTLMADNRDLCRWFIQQIDQNYIKEFLIEGLKLGKYLCLGLIIQAIKIMENWDKDQQQKMFKSLEAKKSSNNIKKAIEAKQIQQKLEQKNAAISAKQQGIQTNQSKTEEQTQKKQSEGNFNWNEDNKDLPSSNVEVVQAKQKSSEQQKQSQQIAPFSELATQNTVDDQKPEDKAKLQQNGETTNQQVKDSEQNQVKTEPEIKTNKQLEPIKNTVQDFEKVEILPVEMKKPEQNLIQQSTQNYDQCILKLIPRLISCLKSRGMTPFAKIFTYLSSIKKYRQELLKLEYPERVIQIILSDNSRLYKPLQYELVDSYFGQQNQSCKQKQLEHSYTFLFESLRYYPGFLTQEQLINFFRDSASRASTKTLAYLLTKTTRSSSQALNQIQFFQQRLLDDKYKREDVQKYCLLIRYYYLLVDSKKMQEQSKTSQETRELIESIKTICINSLTMAIKSNQNSYLFMELGLIEINKLASRCDDFRERWVAKVASNQGLWKALNYWVAESRRPVFLQRNQEWKKKTGNLSHQQRESVTFQNEIDQHRRTAWMLVKVETKHKKHTFDDQSRKASVQKDPRIPEMYSELELTDINKKIVIGFRTFKIIDRLGILAKVEDQRKLARWAVLERNDIETYIDF